MGSYLAAPNAHLAKRDSGGVRGAPIALSVGGPIWHRNFWKKVITDHQNLAHLGNKNETLAKPQKIFGRPKSGRAGKERPSFATTRTPSTHATLHRRNSEVAIVERMDMDNVRAHPQGRGDANCGRDHKRNQTCFALGVGRWHASVLRHGVFASGPRVLVRITAFGGACENLSRQQK